MAGSETGISLLSILRWSEKKDEDGPGSGNKNVQVSGFSSGKKSYIWSRSFSSSGANTAQKFSASRINNIVKARYVRTGSDSKRHIKAHVKYIFEREKGKEEPEREFHSRDKSGHTKEEVTQTMLENRGHNASMFKLILSPKQNELDHVEYTRVILNQWEDQTGIYTDWRFVVHKNTQYHHVHIVMPGRDIFGNSFELSREHLDCFRELANERQYELQKRELDYERDVNREFGKERDDADLLMKHIHGRDYEKRLDWQDKKQLGLYNPDIDKEAEKTLHKDEYFNTQQFIKDLEAEMNIPSPLELDFEPELEDEEPERDEVTESNRLDDKLFETINPASELERSDDSSRQNDSANLLFEMHNSSRDLFEKADSKEDMDKADSLSDRGTRGDRGDDETSNSSRGDR